MCIVSVLVFAQKSAPEPGAGAGERVVFTAEQAKRLQTEKQLSYLTDGVKHGKLNAEEKAFLDRILADPDMSPEYRQILMDRFSSGSEIAQKAFAKFVPDNSVSYSNYTTDSAFYWKRTKSISMSYERDENQFAHMFEAQFDVGRYNQMKMYFPNALRIYEDMLKEVVS